MLEAPRKLAKQVDARIQEKINAKLRAVAALPPPPVFLSINRAIAMSIPMQTAALASLAAHLLFGFTGYLLLTFGLLGSRSFDSPHNVMDVVLVNSKSLTAPSKADALAQANLDGGGNTDEARRAKTSLPAIEQAAKQEARASQERIKQLEQEMKTLMTQAKSSAKVMQGEVSSAPSGSPNAPTAAELIEKAEAISRLEAAISREYEAYQQRPKRTYIGARTTEYRFAQYVDSWRQKVERVGNLNYPAEAKSQKLYGALQLTIAIKANGEVEDVQINRSSGHRVLDEAAKRIVHLAAPYDRFPDNIRRDTDVLHITRTWLFTKADTLTAE
jgi:periplasmic protein TonB